MLPMRYPRSSAVHTRQLCALGRELHTNTHLGLTKVASRSFILDPGNCPDADPNRIGPRVPGRPPKRLESRLDRIMKLGTWLWGPARGGEAFQSFDHALDLIQSQHIAACVPCGRGHKGLGLVPDLPIIGTPNVSWNQRANQLSFTGSWASVSGTHTARVHTRL